MRRITSSLVVAGTVAGIAGAVVAYQSTVTGPTATHPVAAPAAAAEAPQVTTKLLPCEDGTKLVKGICVRTKHRVVVHEVARPPAVASTRTATEQPRNRKNDDDRAKGPRGTTKPQDDDSDGRGEDHEDESEDHESDDHESDDHESDDHESDD